MDAGLATEQADATFEGNLAILRAADGPAAHVIETAVLPDDIAYTCAHDGAPTIRLRDTNGQWRWFGASGAPRVRAEALVTAFELGAGNTLLVGIGQGEVVTVLLGRTAPHQALLVIEPEPVNLRLALTLHDWSEALRTGRLVLVPIVGSTPDAALEAALMHRPGHLAPDRILKWPWMAPHDVQFAADATRIALDRVEAVRHDEMAKCQATLRDAAGRRRGVFVCTTSTDWEPVMLARDLCDEINAAGVECTAFNPRSPARRHRLSLVRALAECNPDGVVLIDAAGDELAGCVPDDLPAASWFADGRLRIDNRDASAPIPLGAPRRDDGASADVKSKVVVLADGAATAASAYGVEIDSHIRLWNALTAMLRVDAAGRTDANVADALRAAERKSGIRITDGTLRRRFIELGERFLWPTVAREHVLDSLTKAGVSFELRGAGWPAGSRWHAVARPSPESARDLELAVAGTLLIDLNALGVRYLHLVAVSVGATVILPAQVGHSPWQGVFESAERPPTWRNINELVALAQGWPAEGRAAAWRRQSARPRSLGEFARELLAALPIAAGGQSR